MASTSGTRLLRRLLLLALLISCFCTSRSTLAQDKIRISTLSFKVVEKGTSKPLSGVNLSIPRGGSYENVPLRDLNLVTDVKGEVSKNNVDFDLTEGRVHPVKLTAEGYHSRVTHSLNDLIRDSNFQPDKKLIILPIELEPVGGGDVSAGHNLNNANATSTNNIATTSGTQNINGTQKDENGKTSIWQDISAFFGRVMDVMNDIAFWVGWLIILFLIGFVLWQFALNPWLRGNHPPLPPPPPVNLRTLDMHLRKLQSRMDNTATKQEVLKLLVGLQNVTDAIKNIKPSSSPTGGGQDRGSSEGGGRGDNAATVVVPISECESVKHLPFKERVQLSYVKLAKRETPDQEPLYVEVQTKTSLFGKLADSTVYLTQATHRQSALVLFTDDDREGLVFPNPALAFRKPSLKDVFPDLTEEMFDAAMEKIEPVRVIRVDESRWKVN